MYTTLSKANDRFGFHAGGTFRCAFKNDRIILSIEMIAAGILIVLLIINFIFFFQQQANAGADASAAINAMIYGNANEAPSSPDDVKYATWGTAVRAGFTIITSVLGLILLFFLIIAIFITHTVLKTGQAYKFTADDNTFTIEYPKKMNRVLTMEYDYITGVKCSEWRFPLAPKCMCVKVITKSGDFDFRLVHTAMSAANGITETPFNIIREKIGISNETDIYLINKQERKI